MFQPDRLSLPNQALPEPDLITAGMPRPQDLQAAAAAGLRSIVNLCPSAETPGEAELVASVGLRYVHIPLAGAADLTRDNAERLAQALDDANARPVLVHCASSNRVGALFALKARYVDGLDADAAIALGRKAGLKAMEPAVRAIFERDG